MRRRPPADPPEIRLQLLGHYRRALEQSGHRRAFFDGAVTVSPWPRLIDAIEAGESVEVYGHVLRRYRRDVEAQGRYCVDADGTVTPVRRSA